MSNKVIGIDLGTTNSCVAVVMDGEPVVIPNEEGSRTTPSVVAFTPDGGRLVGQLARRQAVTNPDRTLYNVKRLMGQRFDAAEVERAAALVPYKIAPSDRGDAWVEVDGELLSPPQVGAMVLETMKDIAEAYLGERVEQAIVTVPAYFDDTQRSATKDAGRIAGLDVLRIINEPTAAALAYGMGRQERELIAVFDLGGGTFDISILELQNGVFEVKSTNGDTFLGGADFDDAVVEWMLDAFEEAHDIDLSEEIVAMQRLKEAAEKAKHELSSCEETDISLPFIASGDAGPVHLQTTLSRAMLEELCDEYIQRLEEPCVQALQDAGIDASALDAVLLVGGMTRMPRVRGKVAEVFGSQPNTDINPDEVVAQGAALQASVLTGEVKEILLLDVTPLSLGIETKGGIFERLIERNTTIPCRKSNIFTTARDSQDMVRVSVFQGERDMASDNKFLGRLELTGIPPAPRGMPEIEVTFELDANGIMHVSAKDLGTGKAQRMRIVSDSGLADEEIDRMLEAAELYREADEQRKDAAEARLELDGLIYTTRRSLDEFGDSLPEADRRHITDTLRNAEAVLDSGDADILRTVRAQLSQAAQRLAEAIYAAAADEAVDMVDEYLAELDEEDDLDDDSDEEDLFDDDSL